MTTEIEHHGMSVTIEDSLLQEMNAIGIDVVEEIKAGIDAAIEDEITHLIHPPIAEIYSKPNCPFCIKAKHILEKRGIAYEELDAVALRETLIERVTAETGQAPRTVPQIWLDGKYIGGHDQLVAYFKAQETEI
jgi:glutaredoxin 3